MKKGYSDYIIILPGNSFSSDFISSLVSTTTYFHQNNHSFLIATGYSPIITSARNGLFSNFSLDSLNGKIPDLDKLTTKIFNDQIECKKIIMIDSDIIWSVEDIKKLIYTDLDVLCGVYSLFDGVTSSVKKHKDMPFSSNKEMSQETDIFEADSSGLGFVSISFDVMKKLEYPWFVVEEEIIEKNGERYQKTTGEDVYFFNKIKNIGYKIHVDPSIKLLHEKVRKVEVI